MSQKHCNINLDLLLFRLISKSRHRSLARLLAMLAVIHYYSDLICPKKEINIYPCTEICACFSVENLKKQIQNNKESFAITLKLILFMKNII